MNFTLPRTLATPKSNITSLRFLVKKKMKHTQDMTPHSPIAALVKQAGLTVSSQEVWGQRSRKSLDLGVLKAGLNTTVQLWLFRIGQQIRSVSGHRGGETSLSKALLPALLTKRKDSIRLSMVLSL